MPRRTSTEPRSTWFRRFTIYSLFVTCALGLTVADLAEAQDSPSQTDPRTARKAVVPSRDSTAEGATYVALASGLESVFRGREPSTVAELKALEAQQSKVAEAIESVTVNVQQGAAQGSGVIITPDGYVLTAAHVAGGPNRQAWVMLHDGTKVEAITYGMNRDMDAGLLKIVTPRSTPWPHATLGRSSVLREGQWVVGAGHPGGWKDNRGSVIRVGRILAIKRGASELNNGRRTAHTLFTDCALIGGDSGGPLFTLEGKLVGIHSRIGTDVSDNMHVPIDVFADSWDRMKDREVWGVLPGYQPVIGVTGTQGDDRPLIASVVDSSPAQRAGLAVGDLVLTFDGVKITTFEELRMGVRARMPGDVVVLTVQRGNQVLRLPVTIGVAQN